MPAPSSTSRANATWRALIETFGPQWAATFGNTPSATWATALDALSDEQLRRGVEFYALKAATPRAFLPNLPEFRFRCLGIPDEHAAIACAVAGDTSTEFLAALVDSVSEWDRRTLAAKDLQARFRTSYARIAMRVSDGQKPALPAPASTASTANGETYPRPPQDGRDGMPTHAGGRAILKGDVQLLIERMQAKGPNVVPIHGETRR